MKKLVLLTLCFLGLCIKSQVLTHAVTFSTGASPLNGGLTTKFFAGRFYQTMQKGEGFVIQKCDLNAIPLTNRVILTYTLGGTHAEQPILFNNANDLYLTHRDPSGRLILMKIDTSNCTPVYTRTYNVTGYNFSKPYDAGFLNSGKILILGTASNNFVNNGVALAICVDPVTNGNVIYTTTLSISTATSAAFTAFSEISNSTILLGGLTENYNFITRGLKGVTALNLSSPPQTYTTTVGTNKLFNYSNAKKVMLYGSASNSSTITTLAKIDTNLALLSSAANSQAISWIHNGFSRGFFSNNKLYSIDFPSNHIDIIDSSLISTSTKTYAVSSGLNFRYVTNSSNSLYISEVRFSPIDQKMETLKTDLNAFLICNSNYTVNKTPYTVTGQAGSISSATTGASSGTVVTTNSLLPLVNVNSCICLQPAAPSNITPTANLNICAGSSASLIVSGSAGTVAWYASPTSTVILGTGNVYNTTTLTAGTYTFYAEATTCTASFTRTPIVVNVLTCTGILEKDQLSQLSIFPNPAKSNINFYTSVDLEVKLFDLLGREIRTVKLEKGSNPIDISNLHSGVYFIKAELNGHNRILRIIKD